MTNREKFLNKVSKEKTNTLEKIEWRIKNRARLRESQKIALKVLTKLDELGWTQRKLAEEMEVKPQQITKILSGKENLTLETQVKLQQILDIPILATYYENIAKEIIASYKVTEHVEYTLQKETVSAKTHNSPVTPKVKLEYHSASKHYTHYSIPA